MIAPAARPAALPPSATVALTDRIAELRSSGRKVFGLAGGDPDFDTPAHITAAAVDALHRGRTHYAPSAGTPELRAAIAAELASRGIARDPDREIVVTASAKYALSLALAAVLDPGDEVIVPDPGWVSYDPLVQLYGGSPVPAADDPGAHITPRTKAILLNSPNNPTGAVLSAERLRAVAELARRHDLVIISDEIYRQISFTGMVHSPAEFAPERTVVVDGVSKAYAMTGWRLGWVTAPVAIASAAQTVQQHTVSCAATFVQDAAVAALTGPQDAVSEMTAVYRARRDRAITALSTLESVTAEPGDGAFYLWVDVSRTGRTSLDFAAWLLDEAGVAVVPGSAFGPAGEGFVRLSMAVADTEIDGALAAIASVLT